MPNPNPQDHAHEHSEAYLDYLGEAFCTEAQKENDKLSVLALAAGAAVWGLSGNAIAGCALSGVILLYSDKSIRHSNRALELMHQTHIAAPFLKGDRFQDFRREFGDELALAQLQQAHEYGVPIQPQAEDYLFEQYPALAGRTPKEDGAGTPALTATTGDRQPLSNFYPQFRFRPTLIWGGQGSGKTTLAKAIAADKVAHGQQVVVINPHGSPAAWDGLPVVGCGRDYAAVNSFMRHYIDQITARYQQFAAMGLSEDDYLQHVIDSGMTATVICEEMSGWHNQLDADLLHEFSQTCLTESRKVGLPPLFVSHDPSLSFLGLKKGARLRDAGMVIVELEPGVPDAQGKLKGTGKGTLQLPQQKPIPFRFAPVGATATNQPEAVQQAAIANQTPVTPPSAHQSPPAALSPTPRSPVEQLENAYKLNAPDEFPAVPPTPPTETETPNNPTADLLRYLTDKGGALPVAALKNWGRNRRKGSLDSDAIDAILIELINRQVIAEFSPPATKAAWVRLVATQ